MQHQLLQFGCLSWAWDSNFNIFIVIEMDALRFTNVLYNFSFLEDTKASCFYGGKAMFCQIDIEVIAGCCIIVGCSCQSTGDFPLVLHFMRVYIRYVSSSGKLFSAWCQQVDSLESQHNHGNHSSLQLEILIIYILSQAMVEFIVLLTTVSKAKHL